MIFLYSGTPGSGKSLHASRDIYNKIKKQRKTVIANFNINDDVFNKNKKGRGKFLYFDNSVLNVDLLVEYSRRYHKANKENQTLLIIDECQVFFNPREFTRSDRMKWNNFFSQHRKLGYNVILISQNDRLIDRQIRANIEYNIIHRKVNNFKIGQLFPIKTFIAVTYWYGVREKLGIEFFIYRKKYGADFYNSFKMFDENLTEANANAKKVLDQIEKEQKGNIINFTCAGAEVGDESHEGVPTSDTVTNNIV